MAYLAYLAWSVASLRQTRSFRLDVRGLDDRPPLLDLRLVVSSERLRGLLRGQRKFEALVTQPLLYDGIGQRLHDGGTELGDDGCGRAMRRPHPARGRCIESRQAPLVDRRDIGRGRETLLGR